MKLRYDVTICKMADARLAERNSMAAPPARLTRNQCLVLEIIRQAPRPIGAYEILRMLEPQGFRSPVQVYRATDKLLSFGAIHRVEKLNAFVACVLPRSDRRQLTVLCICDQCGQVTEFHGGAVEEGLREWARQASLTVTGASVEINVLCAACTRSDGLRYGAAPAL
jgi:Fur family zinc uptake transcriptional regulator